MKQWLFGLTEDDNRLLAWSSNGDLLEFLYGCWQTPSGPVFVDDLRTANYVDPKDLGRIYGAYLPTESECNRNEGN
jgi:hypothetical protein